MAVSPKPGPFTQPVKLRPGSGNAAGSVAGAMRQKAASRKVQNAVTRNQPMQTQTPQAQVHHGSVMGNASMLAAKGDLIKRRK